MWVFETVAKDGMRERLVLRRDPPGHQVQSSRREEFALLRAADEAGLPVPRVRWCEEDAAILGAPFFVMDFVPGETLARRLLRDSRVSLAAIATECGFFDQAHFSRAFRKLHATTPGQYRRTRND